MTFFRIFRGVQRRFARQEAIEGYEHTELVETVFRKTKALVAQGDWPLFANKRAVLDFGGGCGIHYKMARNSSVRWAVVETPAMVARARELATDKLRFFSDIGAAAEWLGSVELTYSNGALQYVGDPLRTLGELCGIGADAMYWERVALSESSEIETEVQSSFLGDNGPDRLSLGRDRIVKYKRQKIPEARFIEAHSAYRLHWRGEDSFHFQKAGGRGDHDADKSDTPRIDAASYDDTCA